MTTEKPRWRQLFDDAVKAHGTVGLARMLGYNNHTLVSRILRGHVEASDKFQARVLRVLTLIDCPHLGQPITDETCTGYASRSFGAIAAPDVPHWRACKKCPHRKEACK